MFLQPRKDYVMSGNVQALNNANFEDAVLASDVPFVVLFCAPWCGPCRSTRSILRELAVDFAEEPIAFGLIDTDDTRGIALKYGIRSIPAMLIFVGGKEVDRKIGAAPKDLFLKIVHSVLLADAEQKR